MENNTGAVTAQETQTQTEERTFTQAELNAIVQNRIKEVSAKYENYEELKEKAQRFDEQVEASKSDLQKATERAESLQAELTAMKTAEQVRLAREEVASTTGIPANLLNGSTKEECEAQAQAILEWVKPNGYPKVTDGGEAIGNYKKSTRDLFKEWFDATV